MQWRTFVMAFLVMPRVVTVFSATLYRIAFHTEVYTKETLVARDSTLDVVREVKRS